MVNQFGVAVILSVCGLALGQFQNQFGSAFQKQQPQYNQQYQQQDQYVSQQRSGSCPDVNGTYPVAGQCDAYIECKNGVSEEKLCPEGLLYNDKLGPHHFPCQYPIDVSCENRAKLQPTQATEECPHQFGYFRIGDRVNCGQFMNCVHGRGFTFDCPEGLAFSQATYRCEWPDEVEDCDAEAFVGFTCPPEARSDTLTDYHFYRHAADCQIYYVCIQGKPRMYRCEGGKLFNDLTNACEAAENVTTCGGASYSGQFRQQKTVQPIQQQQFVQAPAPAPVSQFNQLRATQPPSTFGQYQNQYQQTSQFQQPASFGQFRATQAPVPAFNQFQVQSTAAPRSQFQAQQPSFNQFQTQQARSQFQQTSTRGQQRYTGQF